MLIRRVSDPDYNPWYGLMLPVKHLKLDFRIHSVFHCFLSIERKEAWRLSILVYIENGTFCLMSCGKSNMSPKYKSWKNEAEKRPIRLLLINPVYTDMIYYAYIIKTRISAQERHETPFLGILRRNCQMNLKIKINDLKIISRCIFGANLVILAQIHYTNQFFLEFWFEMVKNDLECIGQ